MLWPAFVHAAGGGYLSLATSLVGMGQPGMLWLLIGTVAVVPFGSCTIRREHAADGGGEDRGALGLISRADPRRVPADLPLRRHRGAGRVDPALAALGLAVVAVETGLEEAGDFRPGCSRRGGCAVIAVALTWSVLRHVFLIMAVWRH